MDVNNVSNYLSKKYLDEIIAKELGYSLKKTYIFDKILFHSLYVIFTNDGFFDKTITNKLIKFIKS